MDAWRFGNLNPLDSRNANVFSRWVGLHPAIADARFVKVSDTSATKSIACSIAPTFTGMPVSLILKSTKNAFLSTGDLKQRYEVPGLLADMRVCIRQRARRHINKQELHTVA